VSSEIDRLRAEVAILRREVDGLRATLNAKTDAGGPEGRSHGEPLRRRVRSVGQFASWILVPSRTRLRYARTFLALRRSDAFDRDFYLSCNGDVARSRVDPLMHYIEHGVSEGREPNPRFSTRYYLEQHPDVAADGVNPLLHWFKHGSPALEHAAVETGWEQGAWAVPADSAHGPGVGERLIDEALRRVHATPRTVSVVLPTYNRRDTIGRALASILAQSLPPLEIIVSDDGSTDGTREFLKERFSDQLDSGLIRYIPGRHGGVSAARNRALDVARGDLVAYLDSDNEWEAHYLLLMVDLFATQPEINTAYCGLTTYGAEDDAEFVRSTPYDRTRLFSGNFIDLNVFMHRRRLWEQLGGFDEELRRLVDWDLILRYTRLYPPAFLPARLGRYFPERASQTISKVEDLEAARSRVLSHHQDELRSRGLSPLRLAYVLWDFPALSQTFVMNELRWLVEHGYDVVVYFRAAPDRAGPVDFPIRSVRVTQDGELADLLIRDGRTLIHSHFVYPAVTLLAYPAAVKANLPFTFMPHAVDLFQRENEKRNRIAEIAQDRLCRRIFVYGPFHRDYLKDRGVPSEKISFTRQAVRIDSGMSERGLEDRLTRPRRVVSTIVRFIEKKGIEYLIEAATSFQGEEVEFRIYGYGPLEEKYRALISKHDIANVRLCGPLEDHDALWRAYAEADIFVLPCVRAVDGDMDGLPTVLMEAMAAGLPVVTTEISAIPDLIEDGVSGLLVPPRDAVALARAIRTVRDMGATEFRRLVLNARDVIDQAVGVQRTTNSLLDVWQAPPIDIVLVTYNTAEFENTADTQDIFRRLVEHTTTAFTMTIVDNGSESSFVQWLEAFAAEHMNVRLLSLERNVMWAPALNLALKHCQSEFIFYVCSKEGFVAKPGWDQECLRYVREHPEVGMAGHLISSPSFSNGEAYQRQPWFSAFRNKEFVRSNADRELHHVQGGLFVLRRPAYEACGAFNPDVPQGGADIEYSSYLESCGWSLGSIPNLYSLTTKTRPTVHAFTDERTIAAHPLTVRSVDALDWVVQRRGRKCNVCGWLGKEFEQIADGIDVCPECGATNFSRTVYRYLAESNLIYRNRDCLAVLPEESLRPELERMFRLRKLVIASAGTSHSPVEAPGLPDQESAEVVIFGNAEGSVALEAATSFASGLFRSVQPGGVALVCDGDGQDVSTESLASHLAVGLEDAGFEVQAVSFTSDVVRFDSRDLLACRRPREPTQV
jgi:glycosyltransferase involved in cell wall biosynthesis